MLSLKGLIKRFIKNDRKIGTLISFPKSGRTWVRVMLDNLDIRLKYTHAGSEYGTKCHFNELPVPTSVQTEGKRIFLFRDPRDTVVSSYFENSKRKKNDADCAEIADFVRDPRYGIEKIVRFNLAWMDEQNFSAFRTYKAISYEALREDPVQGLTAIYTYLKGRTPAGKGLIESVVEEASFSRMQARERSGELAERYGSILRPGNFDDPESFKVRKGKIGGFTDYLSPEDIAYCEEVMNKYQYDRMVADCTHILLTRV